MKKKIPHLKNINTEDISGLRYDDFADMFQEGYSDAEISSEFGLMEGYVKKLRKEYEDDY